ncbi:mesoderm induction early response protein 1-like isoform X5 [Diorhabda carinulata]|uniref:mesoderm induction early response protein 1-like isoform X1 n=1 Tax=Diorhabda sublineata TaxID=1163346 RepID=UPI0024E07C03|nr:mesoderm induction early response protein 1-like isoform X1 [Diorhabda sublineata]XP_057654819.1 mesoderm induction early response protein 1-like isoform X5 [Diorhabda carinulata]
MEQFISSQRNGKDIDSPTKDKIFDPSIDMLVNDFDDERTLEEEEALAAGEFQDPDAELSSLQKESNMPLEELLALYGYRGENQENESPVEEKEEDEPNDCSPGTSRQMDEQESLPSPPEEPSRLKELYEPIPENDHDESRLLRSVSRVSEEEEEDYDYSPDEEDWRKVNKTIMVGSDYQAQIPEGLCHYDDALPYENEDKLIWDPSVPGIDVEEFLMKASAITKPPIPLGTQLRDDEQALYMLQQCGHNIDEALRRLRMTIPANSAETMNESLWSEEECRNFESGIRCYGKNFHKIQQDKVRTRSVGELVQFYYLWKKSERHDIFANKARLEKKKYALHPGLTDFMDRFLEDQDSRDRSSSPNVPCSGGNGKASPDA